MADAIQNHQVRRWTLFRHLSSQIEKLRILATDNPAQLSRKLRQIIPETGHSGQPETFKRPGQSFGTLAQTARPLSVEHRRRQTVLTGKERLAFPGMNEGLDSLEPQKLNPLIVGGAPLFADERVGQPRMGGDDGRGAKTPGRGLHQTQRDPSPQRVADEAVDAVRQTFEQRLNRIVKAAGWVRRLAVSRQVEGQTVGIVADAVQPVLCAAGEAMQEQTAGLSAIQSVASAICASRALSRSISA